MNDILQNDRYIAPGVSVHAIHDYYKKTVEAQEEIHTLQIWQGDRCLCRLAPAPYSCADRREVYSLSKTFCSTAVGCAVDEGLFSVDDRIIDLFPEQVPEQISENLAKMRLRHVLSMNTGHASCVMSKMVRADDVARAFLAEDVPFEPGTHFAYNTGATCLLSALVQKYTGETVRDYLSRKILFPIGARDVVWNMCGEGVNEGGIGIQVTSDDIARLGLLYLHRGVWEGKRLLSEAWIDEATAPHSDNSSNGTPDWRAGYGYQIWCNAEDGYRGDGAFGQLMILLPKKNMMVAVQGVVPDMQVEMRYLLELCAHIFDADAPETLCLPDYAPETTAEISFAGEGAWYRVDENPFGWRTVHLWREDDVFTFDASDGRAPIRLRAGAGRLVQSAYTAVWRKPKLIGLMDAHLPETVRVAASYTVKNGVCCITSRHLSDPHTETVTLTLDGDTLTVSFAFDEGKRNLLETNAKQITAHRIG